VPTPQLTVNYSGALLKLIKTNDAPIDGIEVGPWFTHNEIKRFQAECGDVPFHFHASSLISRMRVKPGRLNRLKRNLVITKSPWLSLHLELLPWYIFILSSNLGIHLPPPEIYKAIQRFINAVHKVQAAVDIPIILENLPSLPLKKYNLAANPVLISKVVKETDAGFLLDIAHARVAAQFQGQSVESYIDEFPLDAWSKCISAAQ